MPDVLTRAAAERAALFRPGVPVVLEPLAHPPDFPDTRAVFALRYADGAAYALKLDLAPGGTGAGRLAAEAAALDRLAQEFADHAALGVAVPEMLSPDGTALVTRLVPGEPAREILRRGAPAAVRADIFRRAGRWLSVLHGSAPAEKVPFWPRWMLREIDALCTGTDLPPSCAGAVGALARTARELVRRPAAKVVAHGDFHGGNLMICPGRTVALDLTEATRKLAVYDMADFLKLDALCPADRAEIAPEGIAAAHLAAFLEGYGGEVDRDVLRFCLRARLVIERLRGARARATPYQRAKADALDLRLSVAFG
ncbi:phosphotransferase [Roseivivax isoporae]|uniref:Aminoglycoside phosphotransferase domain-containing protein n=1 Tax=Roseivivax isoporae LMG 25204 TaxID=1449351 RepID=X7F6W0_9RHOB|nr:phosphotransferase [Roseivivax isoporae]ETX28458.1 hypothetical protein RISW2_07015 [Roseivivax isoporae LMG 25204]